MTYFRCSFWGPEGKQQAVCPLSSCMLVNELVLEAPEDLFANNNMAHWSFIMRFYNWICNKRLDAHTPLWRASLRASLDHWRVAGVGHVCTPWFRWHRLAVAGQISSSCASSAVSLILPQHCSGSDRHWSGPWKQSESVKSCTSHMKICTWPLPHCPSPSHTVSLLC